MSKALYSEKLDIPCWLLRIYKVVNINTGQSWILDGDTKLIYSYLYQLGFIYGFANIYPNYIDIQNALGLNDKKLTRKLSILEDIGLITIWQQKTKIYKSNEYKIKTPDHLKQCLWYDISNNQLSF